MLHAPQQPQYAPNVAVQLCSTASHCSLTQGIMRSRCGSSKINASKVRTARGADTAAHIVHTNGMLSMHCTDAPSGDTPPVKAVVE